MKVLIISDVHGNFEALKAIEELEKYDEMIFLGDAVDYGPQPAESIDFIKTNAKYRIMGNHDYAVAYGEDCQCSPTMHHISEFSRLNISNKLLSENDMKTLKEFQKEVKTEIDGFRIYMTHASPYNNMYGYLFSTEAEMVSRDKNLSEYSYIMIGHTHFPMMYKGRIINPGSAGQPRDGNWKPWYAVLDTDAESIVYRRFRYDNDKVIRELKKVVNEDSDEFRELRKFYT